MEIEKKNTAIKIKIIDSAFIGTLITNTIGKNVYKNQNKQKRVVGFKNVFNNFPVNIPIDKIPMLKAIAIIFSII